MLVFTLTLTWSHRSHERRQKLAIKLRELFIDSAASALWRAFTHQKWGTFPLGTTGQGTAVAKSIRCRGRRPVSRGGEALDYSEPQPPLHGKASEDGARARSR